MRLGRVGRPHGTAGAFHVDDPTDRLTLLEPGRVVGVGGEPHEIAWRGGTESRPLLRLAGIEDRDRAMDLRGRVLDVPREEFGRLDEGEHLARDLIGCTVTDGERRIGVVRDVLTLPSVDCLEVERLGGGGSEPDGQPLLVPLVGDAVRSLDIEARTVDIDLAFIEPGGE